MEKLQTAEMGREHKRKRNRTCPSRIKYEKRRDRVGAGAKRRHQEKRQLRPGKKNLANYFKCKGADSVP